MNSNKYQNFYTEAITHNSVLPSVTKIKEIFSDITIGEFADLTNQIVETKDHNIIQSFLYYLFLFRDMKKIQEFVNSNQFSTELLERLILFTYGYCTLYDYSIERIFDDIFYFVDNRRLLDLVLEAKHIPGDKLLLIYILSNLDTKSLNIYFSKLKDISGFTQTFLKMPDSIMRSIIARNYKLFQYIMHLIMESDYSQMFTKDFFSRYKSDIEQLSRLGDISKKYKEIADIEKEKLLPFSERNMKRISFLVNRIREMKDPIKAIEYFDGEKIFADQEEKEIILSIISDPLFKNTFFYSESL